MPERRTLLWTGVLAALFIAVNAFLTAKGTFILNIVPALIGILLLAFVRLDLLFMAVVFFVPLSLQLEYLMPGLPFNLYLPSEPLIIGIMFLFFLRVLLERKPNRAAMNHPVSLAIWFYLAWMLLTSVTSTMPVVSFKMLLSRIWYIAVFYFLAIRLFEEEKNYYRFFWLYILSFSLIICYTLARHALHGFTQMSSNTMPTPFFKDHTSYGAILAMVLPVLLGMMALKKSFLPGRTWMNWGLLALMLTGILFSYTRAAWLSIAVSFVFFVIILLRIRFTTLVVAGTVLFLLLFSYRSELYMQLERNHTASSKDFSAHLKSSTNIANDPSNLERINRWHCALRMFKERPVFGFGPGTYQFQYAPYQISSEKTIISTDFGNRGNAHSEYLGPLSESGVAGMLGFILIIITVTVTALRVYSHAPSRTLKIISLVMLLSLITYWTHGILNDFLDTDKASVLFWGFTAVIVSLDLKYRGNPAEEGGK